MRGEAKMAKVVRIGGEKRRGQTRGSDLTSLRLGAKKCRSFRLAALGPTGLEWSMRARPKKAMARAALGQIGARRSVFFRLRIVSESCRPAQRLSTSELPLFD